MRCYHGKTGSSEHHTWLDMIKRCTKESSTSYKNYGGRGIKISEEWYDFNVFLKDMGLKPTKKHTIERIDNNKGYCKDNCRWATRTEQAHNKRNNLNLTFKGKTQTISEWGNELGIDRRTIKRRLNLGWSVEKALTLRPIIGRNQYATS